MKILDSQFQAVLGDLLRRRVADRVATRLASEGVVLSRYARRSLEEQLREGVQPVVTLQRWRFWQRSTIRVELADEELEEISTGLIDQIPQLLQSVLDDLPQVMLADLRRRWERESRRQQRERRRFEKRLRRRWGAGLEKLAMLLTIARELGSNLNDDLRADHAKDNPHLVEVLTRLHARACQVADEVLVLLNSGHADGAHARWRTLHEIAVTGLFISKGGEALAERYLAHEAVESARAAKDYADCAERLGYSSLEPGELESVIAMSDAAVAKFGGAFAGQYGWAADYLRKPRIGFETIERAAGVDHLRAHYRMASHNVHANVKGVLFKLGLLKEENVLLTGSSNAGLTDPAHATAISLTQITASLVVLSATLDFSVGLQVMMQLEKEIGQALLESANAIEQRHAE